jgi:trk system potassium uptake protein TrkA
VARIYDPRRAKVYERLGIPTVASVAWTTDQVLRRLLPLGAQEEWRDPSGNVVLAQVYLSPKWVGKRVGDLSEAAKVRVALISRFGGAILPDRDTVIQEGDLIHAIYQVQDRDLVENVFASGAKE